MNFGISTPFFEVFGMAKGAGAKIFALIDSVPVMDALADKGDKPDSCQGNITFENIYFNYPSRPEVDVSITNNLIFKMFL